MKKILQIGIVGIILIGCSSNHQPNIEKNIPMHNLKDAVYLGEKIWQDQRVNMGEKIKQSQAEDYCEDLTLLGLKGWELPSVHDVNSMTSQKSKLKYVKKSTAYHVSDRTCSSIEGASNPISAVLGVAHSVLSTVEVIDDSKRNNTCKYYISSDKIHFHRSRSFALVRCVLDPKIYIDKQKTLQSKAQKFRTQGTWDSYLKAFESSKDIKDIKSAYRLADSLPKKMIAELTMARIIPEKIFLVTAGKTGKSNVSTIKANIFNIGGSSASTKDFTKDFTVSSHFLEVGTYRVIVKFTLNLKYNYTYFGYKKTENNFKYITKTFTLNPSNHFKNTQQVSFKDVVANLKGGAFGIQTLDGGLQEATISYDIVDVR